MEWFNVYMLTLGVVAGSGVTYWLMRAKKAVQRKRSEAALRAAKTRRDAGLKKVAQLMNGDANLQSQVAQQTGPRINPFQ